MPTISPPDWGHAFALRFLDHVRARIVPFQEETGHMYNLEATPAEGTTYRFARKTASASRISCRPARPKSRTTPTPASFPVGYTDDPFEALELQEELQKKYTGGTVLHLYMGERVSSAEACKKLVRRALENFRLPYITITPTFSICPKHGYLDGEHVFCPKCDVELIARKEQAVSQPSNSKGKPCKPHLDRNRSRTATLRDEERQPCEVWTRVMGYHRPVSSFNRGKQGEFHERKCFVEAKARLNLRVGGLARLSTCDWPGELVATVFCQGCAWDCPYCHNPHLRPAQAERYLHWSSRIGVSCKPPRPTRCRRLLRRRTDAAGGAARCSAERAQSWFSCRPAHRGHSAGSALRRCCLGSIG